MKKVAMASMHSASTRNYPGNIILFEAVAKYFRRKQKLN